MNLAIFSEDPLYKFVNRKQKSLRFGTFIICLCLFTWFPLLILTMLSNIDFNLFLNDFDVHVRLLISLALLLLSETIAENRFQTVAQLFISSEIIPEQNRKKYNSIIAFATKLSNLVWIQIGLFLFVMTVGRWISSQIIPYDISVWYAQKIGNTIQLTLPGYWYAYVSLPIFQFFLLRWYYRILVWYFFLWRVSRLSLQLNSLHPDKAGGIGFLVNSVFGLIPFLMAQSFLLSGIIFTAILNTNKTIWNFEYEIITWIFILILIPLIPLSFFMLQLVRNKKTGTNAYSVTSTNYVNAFRKKWINIHEYDQKMLGSSDIQSLADLGNSFNVSAQMQIFPIKLQSILSLIIMTALPFVPLLFTVLSLDKLIIQLAKTVF